MKKKKSKIKKNSIKPTKKKAAKAKKIIKKPAKIKKPVPLKKTNKNKITSKKIKVPKEVQKVHNIKKEETAPKPDTSKILNLLKEKGVRQILVNTAGENTIAVLRELPITGTDEKIAEKLKIKVSDVRSVLNKLHTESLVFYERSRDEETGWYYYNWIINIEKMESWIQEQKDENEKKITSLVENGERYFCNGCGVENIYEVANAMDFQFKCPKCEKSLEYLNEEIARKLFNIEKTI